MSELSDWIRQNIGLERAVQVKLFASLAAVLCLWIIHLVIRRAVIPRIEDIYTRYRTRKITGYVVFIVGILVVSRVWITGFGSAGTFLGLLSAGLAIALKDPLANLAGWVFIVWRRPFQVGDRIEVGGQGGDVVDIRIFQFTLMEIGNWVDADQSTGRVVHVPNQVVFVHPLANYSRGFHYIWNEIPVLVTFESNWRRAKDILGQIAARHAEALSETAEETLRVAAGRFMIFYAKLKPTVYTCVKDSGVMLTIRYLCEPRKRRDTTEAMWEDILVEFAKCDDVDFAYPTERRFNNAVEGKPRARAQAGD
jgi:small-conductance mechanosensitive channel